MINYSLALRVIHAGANAGAKAYWDDETRTLAIGNTDFDFISWQFDATEGVLAGCFSSPEGKEAAGEIYLASFWLEVTRLNNDGRLPKEV